MYCTVYFWLVDWDVWLMIMSVILFRKRSWKTLSARVPLTCGRKTLLPLLKNSMYVNAQCRQSTLILSISPLLNFVFICVILCSPLQVVEAKQAQDESAGIVGKPLKVKGLKTKVKKAQLAEVMPSPHGIRVVPRITPEMRAEAEKKTKKKVKVKRNIPNVQSSFTSSSIQS